MTETAHTTELLLAVGDGDPAAAEELLPLVYEQLRALADSYLARERRDHTLQPTALVHEAYLRLVGPSQPAWNGRAHFLAVAARAMRRTLVNHAVAHNALKRGGGRTRLSFDPSLAPVHSAHADALELSDAIDRLAELDPRKARLLEMRFFAGMTMEESSRVLDVSLSTAEADWRFARAWLAHELGNPATNSHKARD
jgi:RNA polymerase sigma factor (TIGR02999 family)